MKCSCGQEAVLMISNAKECNRPMRYYQCPGCGKRSAASTSEAVAAVNWSIINGEKTNAAIPIRHKRTRNTF